MIRIKRTSRKYEYVAHGELELLNKEKSDREQRVVTRKDRIRFSGMLILTVVVITVMSVFIYSKERHGYDAIQQPAYPLKAKARSVPDLITLLKQIRTTIPTRNRPPSKHLRNPL